MIGNGTHAMMLSFSKVRGLGVTRGKIVGTASVRRGTLMNSRQIWGSVFDTSDNTIRFVIAGEASGDSGSHLSKTQLEQDTYDPVNKAFRIVLV
jgi:hypothetical protein